MVIITDPLPELNDQLQEARVKGSTQMGQLLTASASTVPSMVAVMQATASSCSKKYFDLGKKSEVKFTRDFYTDHLILLNDIFKVYAEVIYDTELIL